MARFDCTTAAGLRDALARTQFEPYDLAEDALRIVGERVVVYANTRSVADLFSSCRELRGLSNAWWRAHADMLKYFEERLYDAAEAEARELPPYTRRLDAGRNDPIGDLEAPPWHPRDYAKHEQSLHENNRAPTNQISWKVLKCVGSWTRILTTRVHLEYLAWLLHPIPGFRVELVKQRPVWKSTSVSGAPYTSSLSHFSATTRPSWLGRAVRKRHRHAIEQASRRWRGGRRDDSARTRRKILISTQAVAFAEASEAFLNNLQDAEGDAYGAQFADYSTSVGSGGQSPSATMLGKARKDVERAQRSYAELLKLLAPLR